jgi:HPt (histidine-containing phosphotransfer) domain-containing protein
MHNINQAEALTASDYIGIVLEKTKNNRALAFTVFKKLFEELPQQLISIESAITAGQYEDAKDIAHKMYGSACFCGLTGIQEPARKLEQYMINENYPAITHDLRLLQQRVSLFTQYQKLILSEFDPSIR